MLRKHIMSIQFIPLDKMDPADIPLKRDFSSKDIKRFPGGPDDDKIIGYYRVDIDQHLWNRDGKHQPKYHGGKPVYYYPVSKREYKQFGDHPTSSDFGNFYRF